jgi:hypothetical protein
MEKYAMPKHLLWAALFLKTYEAEGVLAGMVGPVDEKTFSKWVWYFVDKLHLIEQDVVRIFVYSLCPLCLPLCLCNYHCYSLQKFLFLTLQFSI